MFGARLNVDVAAVLTIVSQLLREGDLIANSEFKKCGHSTQHGRYSMSRHHQKTILVCRQPPPGPAGPWGTCAECTVP